MVEQNLASKWWGTTDIDSIATWIKDVNDDSTIHSIVNFWPIAFAEDYELRMKELELLVGIPAVDFGQVDVGPVLPDGEARSMYACHRQPGVIKSLRTEIRLRAGFMDRQQPTHSTSADRQEQDFGRMNNQTDERVLEAALKRCRGSFPSFAYPWHGLEDFMASRDETKLALIGYGSLINRQSAGRTINADGSARRIAVRAFGAKRIFNYRMPAELLERQYGTPPGTRQVAALNCELSGSPADKFNGILTHVQSDRLDALRDREKRYSLRPLVYRAWDEVQAEPAVAYVLELLPNVTDADHPYDTSILPHVDYTKLCQAGALAISEEFLAFFNETSFLADKITRLSEYILPTEDI